MRTGAGSTRDIGRGRAGFPVHTCYNLVWITGVWGLDYRRRVTNLNETYAAIFSTLRIAVSDSDYVNIPSIVTVAYGHRERSQIALPKLR